MAITKTWEVTGLTRDIRDGYVYAVQYKVTATDGKEELGVSTGEVGFMNKPDSLPKDFIDYSKLDEATTLGWVKTELGTEQIAKIEKVIEFLNKLAHGKPW